MDGVFNRPLFRRREARDRLNEMAGVQGYQAGGPIRSGMEMEARRIDPQTAELDRRVIPSLIPINRPTTFTGGIGADPSGAIIRQNRQPLIRPEGIATIPGSADTILADDLEFTRLNDAVAQAKQKLERAQFYFNQDPSRENIEAYTAARKEFDALAQQQAQFNENYVPGLGGMPEGRGILALEGPEEAMRRMSLEEIDVFNERYRAAQNALPDVVAKETAPPRPAPKPETPVGFGARPEAPAAGMPAAIPVPAAQGPAFERAGRGAGPLITNPAEVAAGLNAPDPAVRERTVQDFMQEFMANAPKYEGGDKRLMHAMIGFAIAAGDSPNAMTNIANGLLVGSEMMLKDKAEKAAFDRQIQLNAMQYGLEGVAKEREKGRPELQFTAVKDMVWKGRRVKEGQPVYLSYNDIENAGGVVPDGLLDAATYTGLIEKQAGVREVLQDQYDRGLIDDAELRQNMDDYTVAATNVARSQRALDYFERALFKIGKDGTITGIPGAFQKLVGKMGAAAGFSTSELDALAKSGDAAEMEELLLRGVLDTVPSVVEGQSANSISDTDVRLAIRRLVALATEQGSFSSLFTSEDTVIRQVQDAMNLIAGNRQRAFSAMSAIEGRLANRVTKAGDFYSPAYASDLLVPLRESAGLSMQPDALSSYGDMVLQEDGSYKLIFPEG